jgi:hypothetical protein
MIYLIHCKNLCKWYNVPPPSTTIKKEDKLEYQKYPQFKRSMKKGKMG